MTVRTQGPLDNLGASSSTRARLGFSRVGLAQDDNFTHWRGLGQQDNFKKPPIRNSKLEANL